MWGKGIYFARDASYAKSYAPRDPNDHNNFVLIVARVLLGRT